MSSVSRSSSQGFSSVMSAVSAAASSVTTGFEVIGDVSGVARVKSSDWLMDARIKSAAARVQKNVIIANETGIDMAKRLRETQKELDADAELKLLYDKLAPSIEAAIASVTGTAVTP